MSCDEVESLLLRAVVGISTEMTLCECEKAQGAPNGLSCDKEGWFISSFEREGSWVRTSCLSSWFQWTQSSSTCSTAFSAAAALHASIPCPFVRMIRFLILLLVQQQGPFCVCLQLSGGGLVPLSHAVCCRPCLPTELPKTQAPIPPDASAVAVMSIGCHASSGNGPWALRCEQQGSSVVTG